MVPFAIGVSGTISNGTWCQLVAPAIAPASVPQAPVTGGTQWGEWTGAQFDLASYLIVVSAGTPAGTATFQELFADLVTWVPLIAPAPITLAASTTYQGAFTSSGGAPLGPFLGLRIVLAGMSSITISQMMLKATVRTI